MDNVLSPPFVCRRMLRRGRMESALLVYVHDNVYQSGARNRICARERIGKQDRRYESRPLSEQCFLAYLFFTGINSISNLFYSKKLVPLKSFNWAKICYICLLSPSSDLFFFVCLFSSGILISVLVDASGKGKETKWTPSNVVHLYKVWRAMREKRFLVCKGDLPVQWSTKFIILFQSLL